MQEEQPTGCTRTCLKVLSGTDFVLAGTRARFYRWKSKYGGMEVSEGRWLKQLEDENRQLKHVVAELTEDQGRLTAKTNGASGRVLRCA